MISQPDLYEGICRSALYPDLSKEDQQAIESLNLTSFYGQGERAFCYYKSKDEVEALFCGLSNEASLRYSFEEMVRLAKDTEKACQELRKKVVSLEEKKPGLAPVAKLTAGPAGCGKTTLIDALSAMEDRVLPRFYLDHPSLFQMTFSYQEDCHQAELRSLRGQSAASEKELYAKWLPGSQAMAHRLLMEITKIAYDRLHQEVKPQGSLQSLSFWCDTSLIAEESASLLDHLKKSGFFIHLHHLSAPQAVLKSSIEKQFPQVKEFREERFLFAKHIFDTYIKRADLIFFYHRAHIAEYPSLAALWQKAGPQLTDRSQEGKRTGEILGHLSIDDQKNYLAITEIHQAALSGVEPSDDFLWPKGLSPNT